MPIPRHAVIVISSHVARGSVGNRAIVFALETLGYPVWAVPTITLPWHPGHGPATRIVPPPADFAAFLRDLANAPWLGEVAAVLSGYLGDASQAGAIAALVRRVKEHNPEALYLCDPVVGDAGGLYVPERTAIAMREELMPLADIVTPNRYELAWLAGHAPDRAEMLRGAAADLTVPTVLATSMPGDSPGRLGNLLLGPDTACFAEHDTIDDPAKGPGDLTAALYLAWLLRGAEPAEALRRATSAVVETLMRAAERGTDELMLETDAASFSAPAAAVDLRPVKRPARSGGM